MKKKILLFLIPICIFFFKINVYASSFNSSIVGNDTFSSNIKLEINVTDLKDFSSTCDGLCGYVGTLKYDTEKLELVSIEALNGFDLTQGKNIVLYKSTGVKSGSKILTMTFKNKGLSNNEKTTISITNVVASDGEKDISSKDISKTIQYVTQSNNTTTNEKDENNKTNTTTTNKKEEDNKSDTTTNEKSSNNNLSSLIVSNGELVFSKDILIYDVVVNSDVSEIKVDAVSEDAKSSIKGIGTHTLNFGNNVIEVIVTAEDGTVKTYTINVLREDSSDTNNNESKEEDKTTTTDDVDSEKETKESNDIVILVSIILFLVILTIIIGILIKRKNDSDE